MEQGDFIEHFIYYFVSFIILYHLYNFFYLIIFSRKDSYSVFISCKR